MTARKTHAADQFTTDTPMKIHRPAHAQKGWRPEIRPTHDDDEQRKAHADKCWARLAAKEEH